MRGIIKAARVDIGEIETIAHYKQQSHIAGVNSYLILATGLNA